MDRAGWIGLFTRIHDGDDEGEAYHGPATRTILAGIDDATASARPIPGGHTIAEIVQHVLAWREMVADGLAGAPREVGEDDGWRPAEKPWPDLVARLAANQRALLDRLASAPEERLARHAARLRFLVHHELHHMGQVALLRRAGKDRT